CRDRKGVGDWEPEPGSSSALLGWSNVNPNSTHPARRGQEIGVTWTGQHRLASSHPAVRSSCAFEVGRSRVETLFTRDLGRRSLPSNDGALCVALNLRQLRKGP
ncbi:hypothetical protein RRG08_004251, partial [Elysia crispata]